MTSNRFILPLTLHASTSQQTSSISSAQDLIEASCSRATPSALVSWTSLAKDQEALEKDEQTSLDICGVAVGCSDGTVYVFHAATQEKSPSSGSSPGVTNSSRFLRPPSPIPRSKVAQSKSRSSSPSSSLAPFTLSSRSRIVSGLTLEQAEAPKNYVDFEDEPEKLKGMLKGKGPRERMPLSDGTRSLSPSSRLLGSPSPTSTRRSENSPDVVTPSSTSQSVTRPSSPTLSGSPALPAPSPGHPSMSLKFHIFPPWFGDAHAISCMEVVCDGQALLCLQDSGYLSVFSLRDGSCLASSRVEDEQLSPPDGIRAHDMSHHVWSWKRLQVTRYGEKVLVLVCASDSSTNSVAPSDHHSAEDDASEVARIAIFELRHTTVLTDSEPPMLEKLGEWCSDGSACGTALYNSPVDAGLPVQMMFFHITSARRLVVRPLWLSSPKLQSPSVLSGTERSDTTSLTSSPLSNPFKALKIRSAEPVSLIELDKRLRQVALGEELDLGEISFGDRENWTVAGIRVVDSIAVVWADSGMIVFDVDLKALSMSPLGSAISLHDIVDIRSLSPDSYMVVCRDRAEVYTVRRVDPDNDDVTKDATDSSCILQLELLHAVPLPNHSAPEILPNGGVLLVTRDGKGRRSLERLSVVDDVTVGTAGPKGSPEKTLSDTLWRAKRQIKDNDLFLTALLPLELGVIIAGYSDGFIRRSSLANIAADGTSASTKTSSDVSLNAMITSLFVVNVRQTSSRMTVGGGDDGSIACWDIDSLALIARWIVFTGPLQEVAEIPESSNLKGCMLCISHDGTIAVIAIDGYRFLYLIPGSVAPLEHVYLDSENVLLAYSHGWARLWDLRSQEFRRSLTWEKAAEMVAQGEGWVEMQVSHVCFDYASTFMIDLENIISQIIASSQASREKQRQSALTDQYRTILSALLTFGLSADMDRICQEGLAAQACGISVGFVSRDALVSFTSSDPRAPWTVSPEVSAARALSIIAMLRAFMLFEDFADAAHTVIAFYASSLEGLVGSNYQPPSLTYLANAWLNASSELRASIHILFDASIAYMSDEDANRLVENWEPLLPYRQPENQNQTHDAAMALFLCGYVAVAKYNLLSTSTLADISKSIAYYLHDDTSMYRSLAIDLCSKGFTVWQQYVDAMEMLRALFLLATTTRKETISTQNAGPLARAAVLRIASSNSPLFMTTLAFDILHPKNLDHRKSVMQLVAFFIRKQPLVLYPNLPRLVEAVVKSLDPNTTSDRDAVLDTATEILGHVVKTFPTVDFHMATQRLAVGTSEGAVIMYDLKTATRLYVLEGHKKRPVAISFSPDGRRLVTVSLEEGVVLVWKVGSSFSSLFNPGAPPRQGHGGSEPFKRLPFNVGSEAKMTIVGTLEFIRFEWPADRSVKLKIRESTLTFST
ncbi:WD40 repeat-like protein [Neolentinus lepideus HHB14362 ss-1]|uniref:WD40 repeat-like protein n=1 Tax=Neolentinus lepideus HHB14362 ss-1 TaxID=1314782 RepID=A0A165UUM6_9AGAM|nr:WD40 repeat-like protein [Neolentinus lepideus HHB14362 ss-1]